MTAEEKFCFCNSHAHLRSAHPAAGCLVQACECYDLGSSLTPQAVALGVVEAAEAAFARGMHGVRLRDYMLRQIELSVAAERRRLAGRVPECPPGHCRHYPR